MVTKEDIDLATANGECRVGISPIDYDALLEEYRRSRNIQTTKPAEPAKPPRSATHEPVTITPAKPQSYPSEPFLVRTIRAMRQWLSDLERKTRPTN